MLVASENDYKILDNNQQDEYNIVLKASNGDKIALEYILIATCAITIIVIIKITIDAKTSVLLANPIITLKGIQNGDEIGSIDAKTFNSLVGFIIVKYDK